LNFPTGVKLIVIASAVAGVTNNELGLVCFRNGVRGADLASSLVGELRFKKRTCAI
jgi:hypothetical protein